MALGGKEVSAPITCLTLTHRFSKVQLDSSISENEYVSADPYMSTRNSIELEDVPLLQTSYKPKPKRGDPGSSYVKPILKQKPKPTHDRRELDELTNQDLDQKKSYWTVNW